MAGGPPASLDARLGFCAASTTIDLTKAHQKDLDLPMFTDLLACPRCDAPLTNFRCSACRVDFPVIDDIPWLVADPQATRTEWRNRWHMALASLEAEEAQARHALSGVTAGRAAALRLTTFAEGCAAERQSLSTLLNALQIGTPAPLSTYLALKVRLPTRMGLRSYDANVHRDWAWGDAENTGSLRAVQQMLAEHTPQRVLILGAGAGRLAYDLHRLFPSALTVALDLNPLLTTVTRKLANGESVNLTEFPLAPRSAATVAVSRTLTAPGAASANFEVVLADAGRPPFQAGAFDVVITPWLLDVIDVPTDAMLGRVNHLLEDDGLWINHGSVAFRPRDPAACASLEELEELAVEQGFGAITSRTDRLPYMACPDSRHGRMEEIVTLRAYKQRAVDLPDRHQNLPDWIAKGREPVPLLPAFQNQAFSTRIHAFIMSMIDGKRTLKDMAALMEQQRLMPSTDAEVAIQGFLIKMYEEASSGQGL